MRSTREAPNIYDLVGVGLGPSNLSLAVLAEELGIPEQRALSALFLERATEWKWTGYDAIEGNMLSEFYLDLVTPVNPTSKFSFLNYLREHGRLTDFLSSGIVFPSRKEFSDYFRWTAGNLKNVEMGCNVTSVKYNPEHDFFEVSGSKTQESFKIYCLNVVLATGGRQLRDFDRGSLAAEYRRTGALPRSSVTKASIAVVGSGQSSAEILSCLLDSIEEGTRLTWVTRATSINTLDVSAWSQKFFFENGLSEFWSASPTNKVSLNRAIAGLTTGIEPALLAEIIKKIYYRRLDCGAAIEIMTQREVTSVVVEGDRFQLVTGAIQIGPFDAVFDCRGYSSGSDSNGINFDLGTPADTQISKLGTDFSSRYVRRVYNLERLGRSCISENNFISAPVRSKAILNEIIS